jgi:hypothetical protein
MTSLLQIDETLEQIARDRLRVQTLHPRNRDDLDFYDLSVWIIRDGLRAAYIAGMTGRQP